MKNDLVPPSAAASSPGGSFRWVICSLLFFSVAVNYLDRLVLAILKKDLCGELGWSDVDYGWITAAFSFAYAFGYLFGGRLMDRWGVKRGLPIFVFCWSCAAAAHGLCGLIGVEAKFAMSYPWFSWAEKGVVWLTLSMPMTAAGFMLARIALGLTQGGNFPGAIKAVAEWYPAKERALATGIFNAGTNVGAIVCPIGVPWLYAHLGWQSTFYITGATGFVWVAVWWFIYEAPEKHPRLSAGELAYIKQGQVAVQEKAVKVSWLQLLRYRAVWAYVVASILAAPAWGFYQFFVPDFLGKRFGISTQAVGWWTGAFFALAAVGGVAGGWLAGRLIDRGWSLNAARKITLLICALSVVPVFFAPFAPHRVAGRADRRPRGFRPSGLVGQSLQHRLRHDAEGGHQFGGGPRGFRRLFHRRLRQRFHRHDSPEDRQLCLGVRLLLLHVPAVAARDPATRAALAAGNKGLNPCLLPC